MICPHCKQEINASEIESTDNYPLPEPDSEIGRMLLKNGNAIIINGRLAYI